MTKRAILSLAFIVVANVITPNLGIAEECPAGFEPSEQGCSDSERAAGCKDIRMDDGTGCVNFVESDSSSDSDADEQCPAGFVEDDSGCSDDERADGCRDVRLDNGTGCVSH